MIRSIVTITALLPLGLSGCESSQTQSARLEKTGKAKAQTSKITAGAANAVVKVRSTTVLHSANGNAAVVELENTSPSAEVNVPLVISVTGADGKVSYQNNIAGLQPSLQQIAFLAKGQRAFWVNDQVLSVEPPKAVRVTVGRARGALRGAPPKITLHAVKLDADSTGAYATGEVRNTSKVTQRNLPIFGVAVKGGRVVAAGRAIVAKLAPASATKPVRFKIFFIGNPRGGALKLTVAPTVLQEGPSTS